MAEPIQIVLAVADGGGSGGFTGLLLGSGYEVHVAGDDRVAMELVGRGEADILIADGGASDRDGLELCRGVRGWSRDRYVYLILLSVRSDTVDVIAGFSAGADALITPPVDPQELLAWVRAGERLVRLDRALRARNQELSAQVESLREHCARLERAATTDPLTGLWNRRRFEEKFVSDLAWTRRFRQPLTLAMVDLDDFKRINDRYGHASGDEVLRQVARMLQSGLRSYDIAARLGGEEFGILFRGATAEQAAVVCERLRARLQATDLGGLKVPVTVTASFGLATLGPEGTGDLASLIEQADRALYEAKRRGRNRIVIADDYGPDSGPIGLAAQACLIGPGDEANGRAVGLDRPWRGGIPSSRP